EICNREVVIVVGENDRAIREYYEQGGARQFDHLKIGYAVQPIPPGRSKPLGTADALWHGLHSRPDWRGQTFTVCNSDNLYSVAALEQLRQVPQGNAMIAYERTALQFPLERIAQFAVIEKDAAGFLQNIIEKPAPEMLARLADAGGRLGVSINLFRLAYDDILPCLAEVPLHPLRQEKELPAAVMLMVQQYGRPVLILPRAEHVPDLTTPSDIPVVWKYLEREYSGA
ncbi:MAG: sugar phosphate nucleotidyltransferase, partial [candidate division KSB1 bacterium]|nr:sugar phosphate nucleotidyltransferase [candidate division KSB1 bacterium]